MLMYTCTCTYASFDCRIFSMRNLSQVGCLKHSLLSYCVPPPHPAPPRRLFAAALEAKNQEMEEEKAALDLDSTKYAATMTAAAEAKLQAAPVVAAAAEIHKESNEPVGTVGKGANAESRAERGLAATAAVAAVAAVAVATKVRSAAKAQESEKAAAAVTAATAGTVKAKEFKIKAVAAAAARKVCARVSESVF